MPELLYVDNKGNFTDSHGRIITLKGINLDGRSKLPSEPNIPTFIPISDKDLNNSYWDGDNVSFINRPYPLNECHEHFNRIKKWGYNTIRYIFTWESIEHSGPYKYDDDFINFTIEILKIAQIYDLYVFMDPHQDVWSRYSGGSGAPLWTLYSVGLNPKNFKFTNSAIVENFYDADDDDLKNYPKMIWPTNYNRLCCQIMFTLFFGGKDFAPNCIINDLNIQDYLQLHFLNSCDYLYKKINDYDNGSLMNTTIIGFETINEPNFGLISLQDINIIPDHQKLRLGTCPTAIQSMRLGNGISQTVDFYKFTSFGPKKSGTVTVDPKGVKAWLSPEEVKKFDLKYGWERGSNWEMGNCIWANHGVWDIKTGEILKSDYFGINHKTGEIINKDDFTNIYFIEYWGKHFKRIRNLSKTAFALCQPPVLELPPTLIGTDLIDERCVYCPHYYDGLSLMMKTWNTWYNVDTLGLMRGRYSSPLSAIVLGETNIRKCLRNQFQQIKDEGIEYLGNIPCLMSETGMPFDMDDKKAYKDGNYDSQIRALDAISFALDGTCMNHTYWCYSSDNCHKWGDNWNNEDFSFWSKDDFQKNSKFNNYKNNKIFETKKFLTANSSIRNENSDGSSSISYANTILENSSDNLISLPLTLSVESDENGINGTRAASSTIRPYPVKINGIPKSWEFDRYKRTFSLKITPSSSPPIENNSDSTNEYLYPTEIYLPSYQFPVSGGLDLDIDVSSGHWDFDVRTEVLSWWNYEEGLVEEQYITIRIKETVAVEVDDNCCKVM